MHTTCRATNVALQAAIVFYIPFVNVFICTCSVTPLAVVG